MLICVLPSARVIVDDIQRRIVAIQSLERERKGVSSQRIQTSSTDFASLELQSNGSGLKANGVSKVQALLGVSEKVRQYFVAFPSVLTGNVWITGETAWQC